MEFRILYKIIKNQKALTIIELVLAIAISVILLAVVLIYTDPIKTRAKARDTKRISMVSILDTAINSYRMDNNSYPGLSYVLRDSTVLTGSSTDLMDIQSGWFGADLSGYLPSYPIDPINEGIYKILYYSDGYSYEINITLEELSDEMTSDGGNDSTKYEIGNNLNLISP